MLSKLLPTLRSAVVYIMPILSGAAIAQTTINVGPGQSYATIQSGINAAVNGDTVLVAPGTYYEHINFNGKAITVTSSGGATATVIDGGGIAGTATVTFNTGETRTSVLSKFTIQNGGDAMFASIQTGGLWIGAASPTVLNNIIIHNGCVNATVSGSTLFQGNTVGAVDRSTYSNYCSFWGSGLVVGGSGSNNPEIQLDIIGNIIEDNGGIVNFGGNGDVFVGNIIRNNNGPEGAIWIVNSTNLIFVGNLVYGNKANGVSQYPQGAGGMTVTVPSVSSTAYLYYGIIANNTFANNTASPGEYAATQFYLDGDINSFVVSNNIFYGSGTLPALTCDGGYRYLSGPATFSHNDAFNASGPSYDSSCAGVDASNSNISKDPLFANATSENFQLTSSSPLIDAGDNAVIGHLGQYAVSFTTDAAGNPRLQDVTGAPCAIIDMGAYEYPGATKNCYTLETIQSSLNPSMFGQNVIFTVQLTSANGSTPTGVVQFSDGSTVLSTQPVSAVGIATYSTSSLAIGTHPVVAMYQPTGPFGAATAALTQIVNGFTTATSVSCSPVTIPVYGSAVVTARVTSANGMPTGSVTFSDNGIQIIAQSLVNGVASYPYSALTSGMHILTATYLSSGAFASSSTFCSEVVTVLPSTSILTVSPSTTTYGSPVTLTANVTPTTPSAPSPTGNVTFLLGGTALGTSPLTAAATGGPYKNGTTTLTISTLPAGTNNTTCGYSGSNIYASSNCNIVPITVTPAATKLTLTSNLNPASALAAVVFTAHLTYNGQPAPSGSIIMLSLNGQVIALATDSTGSADYSLSSLIPGRYAVAANFAATSNLLASFASLTEEIDAIPTSTSLTVSPNPAYLAQLVTMTASVRAGGSAVNTGNVTFFDGTTPLGTQPVTASGTATYTTATLGVATHAITATYNPPISSFISSTSPIVDEAILPSGFTISLLPTSITLVHGASGTASIQLTSVGNFAGPLALTYGSLPTYATASINPTTVALTAGGTGSSTLKLDTLFKAADTIPTRPGARERPGIFSAFLLLLVPLSFTQRRRVKLILGGALLLVSLQATTGCTNSWYIANSVTPGTYQIPITATDAHGDTQSAILTVNVTP